MEKVVLGFDLGGTNTKGCVINQGGDIRLVKERSSHVNDGIGSVEANIVDMKESLLADPTCLNVQIVGAGFCCPGVVNCDGVVVCNTPNIPGLQGYPMRVNLEEKFGFPVFAMNDAKAQALGEFWAGAAKGAKVTAFLGLGTGVGGAIVSNGEVYLGPSGMAGELGHLSINYKGRPCKCGRIGCLEAYVGAAGILETRNFLINYGKFRFEADDSEARGADVKEIFSMAIKNNPICLEVVEETAFYLAQAIAGIMINWAPDVFVIGGQVSRDGAFFLPIVEKYLGKALGPSLIGLMDNFKLVAAKYPSEGGCLGAAYNALKHLSIV